MLWLMPGTMEEAAGRRQHLEYLSLFYCAEDVKENKEMLTFKLNQINRLAVPISFRRQRY